MSLIDIFCPNLSNPAVKKNMETLTHALGSTRAYEFNNLNHGNTWKQDRYGNKLENLPKSQKEIDDFIKERYHELLALDDMEKTVMMFYNNKQKDNQAEKRDLKQSEQNTEQTKTKTKEEQDAEKKLRRQQVNFINLIRTGIVHSNRPVFYRTSEVLQDVIKNYIDLKLPVKVISHNGTILGVIADDTAYINLDKVTPYSQLYVYTHLWASGLYNSIDSDDQTVWKNICDFVDSSDATDSILSSSEQKIMKQTKQSAMNALGLDTIPTKQNKHYNLFVAEVVSILSGKNSAKLFGQLQPELSETKSHSIYQFKLKLSSIGKMLREFWSKIYNFFRKGMQDANFKVESVYQLANMSFGDMAERMKKQMRSNPIRRENISKMFTDDQLSKVEQDVETLRKSNFQTITFQTTDAMSDKEKVYASEFKKDYETSKLFDRYLHDDTISQSQRVSIKMHFKQCIIELLMGLRNEEFLEKDVETKERYDVIPKDLYGSISNIVNNNKFDPFLDIIEKIGLDVFVAQVKANVIADVKKIDDISAEEQDAIIQNIDTYGDIYFSENDDFLRDTLHSKITFDFANSKITLNKDTQDESAQNINEDTGAEQTEENKSEDVPSSNEDVNEAATRVVDVTEDTVNEFLQLEQLHTNFMRSIDGIIKLYLSQFQNFNASDMFGSYNCDYHEILQTLISIGYNATTLEDLYSRIENLNTSWSNSLIWEMRTNNFFANKLLSNLQKARNEIIKYKTSEDLGFTSQAMTTVVDQIADISALAIQKNIGNNENSLIYLGDDNIYHLSETKLSELRDKVKNVAKAFAKALRNVPTETIVLKKAYNANKEGTIVEQPAVVTHVTNDGKTYDAAMLKVMGFAGDTSNDATILNLLRDLGFGSEYYASVLKLIQKPSSKGNFARSSEHITDALQAIQNALSNLDKKFNNSKIKFTTVDELLQHDKGIVSIVKNMSGGFLNQMPIRYAYSVSVGADKPFAVFSPLNNANKTVDSLKEEGGSVRTRIQNDLFNKPIYDNDNPNFMNDVVRLAEAQRNSVLRLNTTTVFDGLKYSEFNSLYYVVYAFTNWKKGNYILPVLADKSTHYSISGLSKDLGTWKNNIYENEKALQKFFVTFVQEVERMKNNRALGYKYNGDPQSDQIIFGDSVRFVFFPYFNDLLRNINDLEKTNVKLQGNDLLIAEELRDYILGKRNNFSDTIIDRIKTKITTHLNNECSKWIKQLDSIVGFMSKYQKNINSEYVTQLTIQSQKVIEEIIDNPQNAYNFFWNQSYAFMQTYQLFMSDIIHFPNVTDTVKRSPQIISPGTKQNYHDNIYSQGLNADGSSKFSDNMKRYIMLPDEIHSTEQTNPVIIKTLLNMKASFKDQINAMSGLSQEEKNDLITENNLYINACIAECKKYDATDGQGIISIDYLGRMLNALGRDSRFQKIYRKIVAVIDHYNPLLEGDEKIQNKNECLYGIKDNDQVKLEGIVDIFKNNTFTQDIIKQFTYFLNTVDTGIPNTRTGQNWQHIEPTQVKNAERPLLDLLNLFTSEDETKLVLLKMMREEGIDAIYYKSNLKVNKPKHSAVTCKLTEYNGDVKKLYNDLKQAVRDDYHNTVIEVPIEEVSLQQETHSHYKDFQIVAGNQILKLFANDLDLNDNYQIGDVVDKEGETHSIAMSGQQMMKSFWNILARKIKLKQDKETYSTIAANIDKNYNGDYKAEIDHNRHLSKMLRASINQDDKIHSDLSKSLMLNKEGDFTINPNDPLMFGEIQKLLTNSVKRAAARVEVNGAMLIQASNAVTTYLQSMSANKEGTKIKKGQDLHIVYKAHNGRPVAIDYVEARIPPYSKKLMKYADERGIIDIEAIKKDGNEKLLDCVAYRIPTEGYCSMLPIKIVGFTNDIGGGLIELPDEVTWLMGVDFDIDKLFVITPSIKEKDGKIDIPQPHFKDPVNDNNAQCNNGILQIIRTALRSKSVFNSYFIPSNFFKLKHESYIWEQIRLQIEQASEHGGTVLTDINQLYDNLKVLSNAELKNLNDKTTTDIDLSLITTQLDMHRKNYSGKTILGIAASTSTVHSMARNWNLKLNNPDRFTFLGQTIKRGCEFDRRYCFDGVTEVQETIRQILTASPDTAKDPVFIGLNITDFTISLATTLARLGFDIKAIALFLNQPVIQHMSKVAEYDTSPYNSDTWDYFKNYFEFLGKEIGKKTTDPKLITTTEIVDEETGKTKTIRKLVFDANYDIPRNVLMQNVSKSLPNEILKKDDALFNFISTQNAIYQIAKSLHRISNNTRIIKDIVNLNNQTDSAYENMFELMAAQNKLAKTLNTISSGNHMVSSNLAGVLQKDKPNFNPFLYQCYVTRDKALKKYASAVIPGFDNFMNYVVPAIKPTESEQNRMKASNYYNMYNAWYTYCFFNMPHDEQQGYLDKDADLIEFYKKYFPTIAAKKVQTLLSSSAYHDNMFLRKLKFSSNAITMSVQDLSAAQRDKFMQDWAVLLKDDDQNVVDFAKELFIYGLYKEGFKFNASTILRCTPYEIKLSVPQYNQFLKRMGMIPISELDGLVKEFKIVYTKNTTAVHLGGGGFHTYYRENYTYDLEKAKVQVEINTPEITIMAKNLTTDRVQLFNVDIDGNMLSQAAEKESKICLS